MKKRRIIYGVPGMMEYQTYVRVGQNNVKLNFTDGSMSSMGMHPATLTTESLMIQEAIEQSDQFKRGIIKRIKVINLEEEIKVLKNPAKTAYSQEGTNEKDKNKVAPLNAEKSKNTESKEGKNDEPSEENNGDGEPEVGTPTEEGSTSNELQQVKVAGNDEAKDYLVNNFGLVRSRLRVRDDIINAGIQNGIEFVFGK